MATVTPARPVQYLLTTDMMFCSDDSDAVDRFLSLDARQIVTPSTAHLDIITSKKIGTSV